MKRVKRLLLIGAGLWSVLLIGSALEALGETKPAPASEQVAPAPKAKPKAKARRASKKKVKRKAVKQSIALPTASSEKRRSLQSWLRDLKKRLEKSRARQNQIVAVAAVRGNEAADAPPLYWKGKKAAGPAEMPELTEFETAVDLALTGDPSAREKLSSFLAANPNSSLAADAQETLNRLSETPAP